MPVSTLRILDKVKERYEEDLKVLVAVLVRLFITLAGYGMRLTRVVD